MTSRQEYGAILERVAVDNHTAEDVEALRNAVTVSGDRNIIQVGGYNVHLGQARDVHVGNRVYRGVEAEQIRAVLTEVIRTSGQDGRGSLRGIGGAVVTIGMIIALVGMAVFFYQLISLIASDTPTSGPPPMLLQGFGIAFTGIIVGAAGHLIRGWENPRR